MPESDLVPCRTCSSLWLPGRLSDDRRCVDCVDADATAQIVWRTEECWMCHGEGELHLRDEVPA